MKEVGAGSKKSAARGGEGYRFYLGTTEKLRSKGLGFLALPLRGPGTSRKGLLTLFGS